MSGLKTTIEYGGLNQTLAGGPDRSVIGRIGARNQSREAKARGGRNRSPETMSLAGRIGGPKGGRRLHELYPKLARENGKKYGPKGAKRRYALYGCPLTLEDHVKGGRIGGPIANHNRWHVRRGKFNPLCQLCRPEFFDLWEGGNA